MKIPAVYPLRKGFSLQLFKSADLIPVSPWNKLVGNNSLFLSLNYLKALEHSLEKPHRHTYALLYKEEVAIAALYFQAIDLASIKIGSVIHAEPYGKFLKLVSDKITRSLLQRSGKGAKWLLVNGNMCASGAYGIACNSENQPLLAGIYPEVLKSVNNFLENDGEVSVSIIKDFSFDNDYLFSVLTGEKFIRFIMDPVMMMNIDTGWKDQEDYLQSLSSKYRLRASNVINKVASLELHELDAGTILKLSDKLDVLYQSVIGKSPVRIVHPDIQYIYHLKEELKDKFKVKCWFNNGEPVAFYTALFSNNETEAHHIGIDYHFNKSHALYQNILYSLVKDSIESKSTTLNYGRTAMEMKSTVGARPIDFAAYIKLNSKVLNHLIKPFLPNHAPSDWVQRDPFRKL